MRREAIFENRPAPTLWCSFNGDLVDKSPNNYQPQLLNNSDFQYYQSSAIIGSSNKCVRYQVDEFCNDGDFSVYFRVFPTGFSPDTDSNTGCTILSASQSSLQNYYAATIFSITKSGKLHCLFRKATGDTAVTELILDDFQMALNEWQEIVVVRKSGVLNLYKDMQLLYSNTLNYPVFTNGQNYIAIGNDYIYRPQYRNFNGYIDEVIYWNNTAIL